MFRKLRKKTKRAVAITIILACVVALIAWFFDVPTHTINPSVSELAPGAAPAIVRALGPSGLYRVGQVISEGNARTWYSGGTHRLSGSIDGRPYGNAFDILIIPFHDPDADTHALRMQGIAAWHRGPDAPGGPAGMGAHIHCVWPGYQSHNPENAQQISSFVHGWRALADRGRPLVDWRDPSIRPDEIARVRRVYERVHGAGSLGRTVAYDEIHRGIRAG